ncbi:MAG: hypothetical protein WBK91_03925 [Alphaproteobacteria bacterium]
MRGFLFIGFVLMIAGILTSNPSPAAKIEHIDWGQVEQDAEWKAAMEVAARAMPPQTRKPVKNWAGVR